jgi:wobble nucleotide-excising tRNase
LGFGGTNAYNKFTMSDDHYAGALLEDIDSKLDLILESQATLATSHELKAIDERLTRVEDNVELIRRVVTETNRDVKNHENRISDLEDDDLEYA